VEELLTERGVVLTDETVRQRHSRWRAVDQDGDVREILYNPGAIRPPCASYGNC